MSEGHRQPKAFVIEEEEAPPPMPETKRKPRAITGIEFPPDESLGELAVLAPAPPRTRGRAGG